MTEGMKQRPERFLYTGGGTHILYVYDDQSEYIHNAAAFIAEGWTRQENVFCVDRRDRYESILACLSKQAAGRNTGIIHFEDSEAFYETEAEFHPGTILHKYAHLLGPSVQNGIPLRVWGGIEWADQDELEEKLQIYECECDLLTSDKKDVLVVCAYPGSRITGRMLSRLMKHHEYLMTDTELVGSALYGRKENNIIYPSLSTQTKMEAEVDFYKQKLDFVHVVSHEVRNPLTVIQAYAAMLLKGELDEGAKEKLRRIQDYVTVIDSEITHIINTEQMLNSESLWRVSRISPLEVLADVLAIMETKARTQNIRLLKKVRLNGQEYMDGNAIGLRLIISNLLGNAIKYSEEGGAVRVDAAILEGELCLRIEDDGVGMSELQLKLLFQKYEKLSAERSGQGIGLFMVKKLLDHFGGDIQVSSRLQEGTSVEVRMPLKGN